jgi:serine/threonine protein kinase
MSNADRLAPGSVFAKDFRIVGVLGAGEMGTSYIAEAVAAESKCVLKVLVPQLLAGGAKETFSSAVAAIGGPHLVRVVGAGFDQESDRGWVATELLQGEELGARIARTGPLDPRDARRVGQELCDALAAAHDARLVHHDLTPENVFLASTADAPFTVKVRELGISRVVSGALAAHGELFGSPIWMPPEQFELGRELTPSANVWSLGLLVFYALTGHSFWKHATEEGPPSKALLREIVVEPLSRASERAAQLGCGKLIPSWFPDWFARCVAREPKDRFADARAAAAVFVDGPSVPLPTPPPPAMPPSIHPLPSATATPSASGAVAASSAVATVPTSIANPTPTSIAATPAIPAVKPPPPPLAVPVAASTPIAVPTPTPPATVPPIRSPIAATIAASIATPTSNPTPTPGPTATTSRARPRDSVRSKPAPPRSRRSPWFRYFIVASAIAGVSVWLWDARRAGGVDSLRTTAQAPPTANAPASQDPVPTAAPVPPIAVAATELTEADAAPLGTPTPAPPVTGSLPPGEYDFDGALKALNAVFYGDCSVPKAGQIQVTFAPTGRVRSVEVAQGDYDAVTRACLAARFKAATMPPFRGKPQLVKATIVATR